ncbi:hypothetical protein [Polyangium spumosum]|uniref:Uncharacterized protein n=1 Tax=Polyangium spumosum TaxID=889282 RepID=A0A6N7PLA9_9BACT|nr:hypothetical protein [Polyangium spumosum]MRG92818.1 hypothetical protein [Polyangium spumosum]
MIFTVTIDGRGIREMPLEHKTLAVAVMAYAEAVLAGMDATHTSIVQNIALSPKVPGYPTALETGEMQIRPLNQNQTLELVQAFVEEAFLGLDIKVRFVVPPAPAGREDE